MHQIHSLLAAILGSALAAAGAAADSANASPSFAAASSSAPLRLSANLTTRILTVRVGGSVVATYAVSVGSNGYPTPTGSFKIRRLVWNPRWVPPEEPWARGKTAKAPGDPDNPMQTVKIFFKEPDYYIHGTPSIGLLGEAASKGCLRMAPDEIAELAEQIMRHGGEPRPPSWFERVRRLARREHVVHLKNPIILTITR